MPRTLLTLVGLIYLTFGCWCLLAPTVAARAVGFDFLDASGRSEFLVVYGGLEIGLGLFFVRAARTEEWVRPALVVLFLTGACLALTRLATLLALSGIRPLTWSLFVGEILMAAAGAWGLHRTRPR